jgi:glycosyltransferase involved in cell wall biosynthesis
VRDELGDVETPCFAITQASTISPQRFTLNGYYRERAEEQNMPELHKQRKKTVISLLPLRFSEQRHFINMFSEELSRQGYIVRAFRWRSLGLHKTKFIVLHWPDEFFVNQKGADKVKSFARLAVIHIAKLLWRTKLVWVAHNAAPHDAINVDSRLRRWFLQSLDGVVFLSQYSHTLIENLYPQLSTRNSVRIVIGHHRGASVKPETPWMIPSGSVRLVQFGLIRPYKNIEALVDAVSSLSSGVELLVAGMAMDRVHSAKITSKAHLLPHITLDFRDAPISEEELEAIVDSADAVVLPYKHILNSGSALFSLSRNRPVLAPNMGSLPELQDNVGTDWVYLYDGEFNRQVLLDFKEWIVNTDRGGVAPLDAYDWSRVGQQLSDFIQTMSGQALGKVASEFFGR